MGLFPLVTWDVCENELADRCLQAWGHWLGKCNRPYGRQSFALTLAGDTIAVAVSASTVAPTCAGYPRGEVVELARLCAHPLHRDMTRVALRLWRVTAGIQWQGKMNRPDLLHSRGWKWQMRAYVSYANATRHSGDIYRFDGWRRAAKVKGSGGDGTWGRKQKAEPKTVWVYELSEGVNDG
jgi:hypothetical protein